MEVWFRWFFLCKWMIFRFRMLTFRRCKGFDRGNSLKLFIGQCEGEMLCQVSPVVSFGNKWWNCLAHESYFRSTRLRILNEMSIDLKKVQPRHQNFRSKQVEQEKTPNSTSTMTAMTQSDHWCTLRYTSEFSWNTGNKQNIWKFNTHTYLAKHVTCRYEQTIKQFKTHTWMKAYCKKVWNVRMLRVDMRLRVHLR